MESEKVSILVPIYGVESFIERCAISLFEQTYENIEYVFVDDCTNDNSIKVLSDVISRYPNRSPQVKVIRHPSNRGLAGTRNTAVYYSTGNFIIHVDSDDYVDISLVKSLVLKQKENDADIVVSSYKKFYSSFSESVEYPLLDSSLEYCLKTVERDIPGTIWGKLIRRSLYIDNNLRCQEGSNQGEDFQVLPLLFYYAKSVAVLKECLYYYDCLNQGSYSNSFTVRKHNENWKSMDIVKSFFEGKGTKFEDAIKKCQVKQLADDFVISAKAKGEVRKCYYEYAYDKLQHIEKKYWSTLSVTKRIVLYLTPIENLMRIYVLMARFAHHLCMSVFFRR